MDNTDTGSRWNRPFNVNQAQTGPAEYVFGMLVGIAAMTLAGLLLEVGGGPMLGEASGYLTAFPAIIGMNSLRARPETYHRNAFWGLRTLVYVISIMAGTCAMIFLQERVVSGIPQPWSGMLVYLVASYVVGLPLLLTTERTHGVRLRRSLLYVYPGSAVVIAIAMWLFDLMFS